MLTLCFWSRAVMLQDTVFHCKAWACFCLPASTISGPLNHGFDSAAELLLTPAVPQPAQVEFSCPAAEVRAPVLCSTHPNLSCHAFATFFIIVFTHHMNICAWCKKVQSLPHLFHCALCPPNVHNSVAVSNSYGMQVICSLIPYIVVSSENPRNSKVNLIESLLLLALSVLPAYSTLLVALVSSFLLFNSCTGLCNEWIPFQV